MQTLPPPPPPAAMTSSQAQSFFAAYPVLIQKGSRYRVLGLNLTGKHEALETAKAKLTTEGLSAEYMRDRSGAEVLSINTSGWSVEQVVKMNGRLRSHDFGNLDSQLFAIPDPSAAK